MGRNLLVGVGIAIVACSDAGITNNQLNEPAPERAPIEGYGNIRFGTSFVNALGALGRDLFNPLDSQFLPVSPAQGPFYDLLKARPETGKRLIRRLVDHAIEAETRGYNGEPGAFEIQMPEGVRRFLWPHTLPWSREHGARYYAASSGLMALEGWGHGRIEAGEDVEAVISDIVGPGDAPAAYLMIAVDLILSHWPASKAAAVPYVANPHLLVMDRNRQAQEHIELPDIFGFKELQREPQGPLNAKSLADRPSRRASLDALLKFYTFSEETEHRDRIVGLLETAKDSMDEVTPESNFGDPEFMVLHALNQLDPANWQPQEVEMEDGSTRQIQAYVSPTNEAEHLAPFQAEAQEAFLSVQVQKTAALLLENPGRSTPEGLKVLLAWATAKAFPAGVHAEDEERDVAAWSLGETMMNIALLAMREGDAELRQSARDWAHDVFAKRLSQPIDRASGTLDRLQFNPLAIAFVGYSFSLRDRTDETDVRTLLEIAAHDSPVASRGFAASAAAIAAVDERILKSVLRCALKASVFCHRDWHDEEGVYEARKAEMRSEVEAAVACELAWLFGRADEPSWPDWPYRDPSPHRGMRLSGGAVEPRQRRTRPEEGVESTGAGRWLDALRHLADSAMRPWLRELVEHYRPWTLNANGGSLDDDDDIDRVPTEWNDAYFRLMAACVPGLSIEEVDSFVLDDMRGLPSNAMLSVGGRFIRSLDVIYLDTDRIQPAVVSHVRQSFADAMREHYSWPRFAADRSASVESKMGDAVSALFFHVYHGGFAPPACYLVPDSADKAHPLLPVLQLVATEAPTILIASEVMAMLEVAPHSAQLPFAVAASMAWVAQRSDDTEFWVDFGIGRRLCKWLDQLVELAAPLFASGSTARAEIDQLLAALVRVGVAEARRLETRLAG